MKKIYYNTKVLRALYSDEYLEVNTLEGEELKKYIEERKKEEMKKSGGFYQKNENTTIKRVCIKHGQEVGLQGECERCVLMRKVNIPQRYETVVGNSKYLDLINSGGICFTGSVGSGKTYELISALMAYNDVKGQYGYAQFNTFGEIMRKIRTASYNGEYEEKYDIYKRCELLVIDDFGVENKTEFSLEFVYNIINDRYNNCLPMLISTNLTSEEITAQYSQRITSRLIEMLTIIKLEGKDKRNHTNI